MHVFTKCYSKPNFTIPYKDAETMALPPISAFISDIFEGGFNEIPPESNVIPFPTNANNDYCDLSPPPPPPL